MRIEGEIAKVLITVKTAPQPSAKYGDTVCVAGIRIDGPAPTWVRLYPIQFRWLDSDRQFRKYDVVTLEMRRRDQDTRPESYSPTIQSIEKVGHLDKWVDREPIMRNVPRTTTCKLRREAASWHAAPSLGMIEIADMGALQFEKHAGWSEPEQKKIAAGLMMQPLDLFGTIQVPPKLVAPRFKVRYKYRCMDSACGGHVGQILDWELSEFQRRLRSSDDSTFKDEVRKRFHEQMWNSKKATSFFLGNFEDPKKRHNYSVLGVYYPDRALATSVPLFDFGGL